MSTYILFADSLQPGGWNVTTSIALAAAVISLVTLVVTTYFSARRETVKWAREALAEAFYAFIDAGLVTRERAREYQDLIRVGASEHELMRAAESLEQQKILMRQAQTKIKLLASARTSEQAEELRVSIRRLAKSVGPELTATEFDVLADRISDRRELFIQQAKKDMSLPS